MRLVVACLGILVVLASSSWLRHDGVAEDTRTVVHAADPLRVRLPVGASKATIARIMRTQLAEQIDAATNPTIEAELRDLAADTERLEWIAESGHERFAAGRTAALAYPLYSVTVDEGAVVVVAMTMELIAGYHGVAESRDHEDGHAYINAELARRCAAAAVGRGAALRLSAADLERMVIDELTRAGDVAHDVYHSYVEDAGLGEHRRYAEAAASEVAASCGR